MTQWSAIAGLAILSLAGIAAESQDSGVVPLRPGERIRTEVAYRAPHRYSVIASARQYLSIVAEDAGGALKFTLTGPDGARIREWPGLGVGQPTQISLVTEDSGQFVLQVENTWEGGDAVSCDLRLEALGAATERDFRLVAARRLFEEAAAADYAETEDGRREAIKKYQQAAKQYEDLGDLVGQGLAYRGIGADYLRLGEVLETLNYWKDAVALMRSAGDRRQEAYSLHAVGAAYNRLSQFEESLDAYRAGREIWRSLGDASGEAGHLASMAHAYSRIGEHRNALDCYERSLAVVRSLGQRTTEMNMRFSIAAEYEFIGDSQRALQTYRALALDNRGEEGVGEEEALRRGAKIQAELEDYQQALEWLHQVLGLYGENRRGRALVLCDLGTVYGRLGEPSRAVEYLDKALETMPANPSTSDLITVDFMRDAGIAYSRAGEKRKALDCFSRGAAEARAGGFSEHEARFLALMASTEGDLGRLEEARDHIEQALATRQAIRGGLRSPEQRSVYFSTFRSYYDLQMQVLLRLDALYPGAGFKVAAFEASENARARSLLELLNEARVDIRRGVDERLLSEQRALLQQIDAREIRRQTLLRRKETRQSAEAVAREIRALTAEQDRLEAQIRNASPGYAALLRPRPLALPDIQRMVLDEDTVLLEYLVADERSHLWAVGKDSLDHFELPGRPVIEKVARRAYARWALAPGARAPRSSSDTAGAAAELGRLVLGPVSPLLGTKRILIVADGVLQYVPFAALPDPERGGRVLMEAHEVVHAPSVSVLARVRESAGGRRPGPHQVAILADPVFERDDPRLGGAWKQGVAQPAPAQRDREVEWSLAATGVVSEGNYISRLPFSRREAGAILALVPPGEALRAVDFRASRSTALSPELAGYRIIHFATHGMINDESPGLSGLVLSLFDEHGKPQNGYLRLNDIYNMTLPADVVVLSACRTALGKDIGGEGLVGLTRGFMYAGATRVVASLWKVDDAATSQLMARFYQGVLKKQLSPAAALRAAQLAMSKLPRWQDPYYWAGFVLQGDWK